MHGLSSNLEIWHLVAPMLAAGHRVIAYDQRSHGRSSDGDGDFSFAALVDDLRAVIDHFALERPVVVGHSWGATVALEYAIATPDAPGVVCVDGAVIDMQGLGTDWAQAEQMLRPPKLVGRTEDIVAMIRGYTGAIGWDVVEPVFMRGRIEQADGTSRPRLPFDDHMTIAHELWGSRTWDLYDRVHVPVMLVLAEGVGEQGFVDIKKQAASRVAERNTGVRIEWLPSVHDVPLHSPRELVALIESFV